MPLRCAIAAVLLVPPAAAQQRLPLDGTWELARDAPDGGRSYDLQVAVPAAFETALGTGFDGVAWYRKTLPLRPHWRGAAVRVEFAAVATHATVFCNGRKIAEHLGGWTPFRADLTETLLWNGADVLEVAVDERVGHNTQGFLPVIQPHFGGIWQPVTLCVDDGPVIDRLSLFAFGRVPGGPAAADAPAGDAAPEGELLWRAEVLPRAGATAARLRAEVLDGARAVAAAETECPQGADVPARLAVPDVRPWRPGAPHLYGLRVTALDARGRELDRVERRVGFRALAADGTTIRWNGAPLQVRGILHWGYSPPHLAPPHAPAHWRCELERFRSLGFNAIKCCLWVPPRCFYELCDELGMLCWQEYPTWHPQMDRAHGQELLAEYREFHRHDGGHAAVAFRSITCETGHGADLQVVTALFEQCKRMVPDTLVVDDSSWIGWQRITDFWDEHPYGNNRWWPGRLRDFARHIAEHGEKPLLLGECIAADTWVYRDDWLAQHGDADPVPWWRPLCMPAQEEFEAWIAREFGAATLRSLGPVSRAYGMATRRYQIERLRMDLPFAGYVVSVARDFAKARMGLHDDFGRAKWTAEEWSWHREAMLCLDTEGDRRAFVVKPGEAPVLHVRPVHGAAVGARVPLPPLPAVDAPGRVALHGAAGGLRGSWHVWALPPFDEARPAGVQVADRLDVATLDHLEQGGRVLLRVAGSKDSLKSSGLWYLRGAPFAPPHPVHDRLPAAMLIDLQPFDLDGGRVIDWRPLRDQVDPILAFWDTHDLAEVRAHLFAFDCRVGEGRLLATCFDRETPAGRYVERELLQHLAQGPPPRRELDADTRAALRALLTQERLDLPVWRFRTDPDDAGRAAGWSDPATDVAGGAWRDLRAGSHWENQASDLEHYTGVAWYRVDFELGEGWRDKAARAVFEGVDDSFECWLDGEPVGSFGDPATRTTIWLERQVAEMGTRLGPGRHTLVLRVVDHGGAGGLWKPVYLTTGPADGRSALLQ